MQQKLTKHLLTNLMKPKFLLKLSELISDFKMTLSYFNPALKKHELERLRYDICLAGSLFCKQRLCARSDVFKIVFSDTNRLRACEKLEDFR